MWISWEKDNAVFLLLFLSWLQRASPLFVYYSFISFFSSWLLASWHFFFPRHVCRILLVRHELGYFNPACHFLSLRRTDVRTDDTWWDGRTDFWKCRTEDRNERTREGDGVLLSSDEIMSTSPIPEHGVATKERILELGWWWIIHPSIFY